jgi:hypothetical protein
LYRWPLDSATQSGQALVHRHQGGQHFGRELASGDDQEVDVAAQGVEIAAGQRAVEVQTHELAPQGGLHSAEQVMQQGVDVRVGCGVAATE